MAKKRKKIRPLRSDTGFRLALGEIELCFDREPKADTTVETMLDSLATIIEADEHERRPIARAKRLKKETATLPSRW